MYFYKKNAREDWMLPTAVVIYEVGYEDSQGNWHAEGSYDRESDAIDRVEHLNGGVSIPLLSKREYFAAAALQGLLSGNNWFDIKVSIERTEIAEMAVKLADATISKLEESPRSAGLPKSNIPSR